jgi:hypothetical protein
MVKVLASRSFIAAVVAAALGAAGCDEEEPPLGLSPTPDAAAGAATVTLDTTGGKRSSLSLGSGQTLAVDVPATSTAWDLSLEGYTLRTNSGPSGPGKGAAYGPVTDKGWADVTSAAVVPHATAWRIDRIASPFDRWYLYDRCPAGMHTLASRHHIYGVEVAGKRYKLQILSYYALVMGAPQGGHFTVRVAEVSGDTVGPARKIAGLDASTTTVYLDLAAGAPVALAEADAKTSMAWDIGLRKSDLFVNGGLAGPKGVRGADLDAGRAEAEADICNMTEASEQTRFEGVGAAAMAGPNVRWKSSDLEDAFQNKWYAYDPASHQITPARGIWVVRGADGSSFYKLEVTGIEGGTMADAGRVTARFAPLAGVAP